MLALSPATARSPAAIKQTTKNFRRKLEANVRYAEATRLSQFQGEVLHRRRP
jgi:hypothetical protein